MQEELRHLGDRHDVNPTESHHRLTPAEFAAKWQGSTRTERAASQEHFIDLCRMLGVPTPNEADSTGEWYAFEKGAEKLDGGDGFADVWKRGHFGWEYKGKRKDLDAAYRQLLEYREALENPPLLVVCDMDRFVVHTNFTDTVKKVYSFTLQELASKPGEPLRVLRAVMTEPGALKPAKTRAEVTEDAAERFARLARTLRDRGHDPHRVAHFLNKLLFVMFAEDAGLLPKQLMRRIADGTRGDPTAFTRALTSLFATMSDKGGHFGAERIDWFNGGLFDGADVVPLESIDVEIVRAVAELDWSEVEPSIFGTLFVRGLDPDKRSQLGAQYTDRESILRLVEPVVMTPLRREFEKLKERVASLLTRGKKTKKGFTPAEKEVMAFQQRLSKVRILDPACGSGNFLYVALQLVKDLENEVVSWASKTLGTTRFFPNAVGPAILLGIEANDYAAELARVTIWIGEIQWMLSHGLNRGKQPILEPLHNIECRDAVLDLSDPERPKEPMWPAAEFIVGNPPFLGAKLLRAGLGDAYVEALYEVYGDRLPGMSDLSCYWHEKARAMIESGQAKRAGLLATQGIRGGLSRRVLERIKESGDMFLAWSDEPWVLDGAAVHVSFVGFDDGSEQLRMLDGHPVANINSDLSSGPDLTKARRLRENLVVAFVADVKGGPFDIPSDVAIQLLREHNPDGRSNGDVIRPWVNGLDIMRRPRGMWIVDFGTDMSDLEAALYQAPFEYIRERVQPMRTQSRTTQKRWWLHERPGHSMRIALTGLQRYIGTPTLTKHRIFVWLTAETLADHQLIVIAREDDYTFGILHSRVHEAWARAQGTQLREVESGFRYTPTSTFETFPFPHPSGVQQDAIAEAAKELNKLREGWLNPEGATAVELGRRTLTKLYNTRPTWLANAHERLDHAVLDAYGWPHDLPNDELLARLLAVNLERDPA